jgi:serpin B
MSTSLGRWSWLVVLAFAAGLLGVVGCGGDDDGETATATPEGSGTPVAAGELIMSDVARSAADPSAMTGAAAATNAFAADLYGRLVEGNSDNLVFSPYSAAVALAMTREGARGETQAEMDAVLHADLAGGGDALGSGFNAMDLSLAEVPGEYSIGDGESVELELATANQLFGQEGFAFHEEFLDALASDFGAGMRLLDYESDPEGSREVINAWVDEQTHERIPELIPEGVINTLTRLVLTNAIYLNAPWEFRFDEANTEAGGFTTLDGDEVEATFMHQTEHLRYGEGDGYQVAELPYVGGRLSMVVLVPDEGELAAIEARLGSGLLDEALGSLQTSSLTLALPQFEFRTEAALKDQLMALGMPLAFTEGAADFSGMTDEAPLLIDDVIHEAFISIDEQGTEAAAATAVVVRVESAPMPAELTVDRPFLFFIRHADSGAVLFMGRVTDPTAS